MKYKAGAIPAFSIDKMKNSFFIFLFLTFFLKTGFTQTGEQMLEYNSYKSIADSFFLENNCDSSVVYFTKAFHILNGKGYQQDKFNAATCYNKINKPDSTFRLFFNLAKKTDFIDFHELNSNSEFENLKTDSRWKELKTILIPENSPKYDSLALVLQKIYDSDQSHRKKITETSTTYGWDSQEMTKLNQDMRLNDSINLILIKNIIEKHGWLGKTKIGKKANTTYWVVIQHSDTTTMKEYFPIMKTAVENGEASRIHLAYLEDRILMFQNKKQIYGTQFQVDKKNGKQTMYQVENKEKLNERRKSVGLYELNLEEIIFKEE